MSKKYEYQVELTSRDNPDFYLAQEKIEDPKRAGDAFREARGHARPGDIVVMSRREVSKWEAIETFEDARPKPGPIVQDLSTDRIHDPLPDGIPVYIWPDLQDAHPTGEIVMTGYAGFEVGQKVGILHRDLPKRMTMFDVTRTLLVGGVECQLIPTLDEDDYSTYVIAEMPDRSRHAQQ